MIYNNDPGSIVTGGHFDVVMFDCDGVLYQSNSVLRGAVETVHALRENNIHVKFITNSSTKSREKMFEKLSSLGFKSISVNDCFPSGYCTAEFLRTSTNAKRVYVIGESGLVEELRQAGLEVIGGPDDNEKCMTDALFIKYGDSFEFSGVDAVVVGYDQHINYYKLASASLCFQQNKKCLLIATNPDRHDRIGGKWLIPVNGCGLAAVIQAVNGLDDQKEPVEPVILGKPNALFGNLVLQVSGLGHVPAERVLMVGDKIETDIALAKNCGFKSCLVLSGCCTREELERSQIPEPTADMILDGLCEVADALEK
jgi:phosphoglycolate phosphatase